MCSRCKSEKEISEFNRKGDKLQPQCRLCDNASSREYYALNREKHKKIILERKKKLRGAVQILYCKWLLEHPCVDCYETNILLLEPDHLRDKSYNISNMINLCHSWESVLKELDKCEIVCKNCHALRTIDRMAVNYKVKFLNHSGVIQG